MKTDNAGLDPWFAVYVRSHHEKNVSRALRNKGYEEFLPLYTQRTRSRTSELPLIPGYVFCRFNAGRRLPILTVPGVVFIVGVAGRPIPVPEHEIGALQKIVQSGLPRYPWPAVAVGQSVVIRTGPLRGVQGVVLTINRSGRLIVSVNLLQRSVGVDIDDTWAEPAMNAARPVQQGAQLPSSQESSAGGGH